jgi:DNA-binding FadR family transcriptional regulator
MTTLRGLSETVREQREEIERLRYDVERLAEAIGRGVAAPEDLGFHLDLVRATHTAALWRVSGAIISFYQWDGHLPTEQDVIDHPLASPSTRP